MKKIELNGKNKKLILKVLIFTFIALFYVFAGCPVRWLTGICCPSCGMSRAAFSLLRLDFSSAVYYHPLVFCLPAGAVVYFFRKHMPAKLIPILFWLFIAALTVVYVIRISSGHEVVYADFSAGIIYKIFIFIKGCV
ncbi:MAG: DUF2752 domain-containing protein [Clostridia bacterium]|nr:DUF2752 domain-containing protein [Clostridia bacterium]